MKQILFCLVVLFAGRALAGPGNESAADRDARMQWWREARFGLFIHWGERTTGSGYGRTQRYL